MEYDYQKIINIPYYQSRAHPRMPMNERAGIFLPFAALSGLDEEMEKEERRSGGGEYDEESNHNKFS